MLKLITINIEKNNHYSRIIPFITKEQPDVLCLQEIPESFIPELHTLGYHTTYAPRLRVLLGENEESLGTAFASKVPHQSRSIYYYGDEARARAILGTNPEDMSFAYIIADIATEQGNYTIATTHLADTKDGHEDDFQIILMTNLLKLLAAEVPHCICGDFNMPRGFNALYEQFITKYTDTIPTHFASSLDKNIHRLGNVAIDEPIFEKYMVDYIFSQSPYQVSAVQLHFGVSDHAAVSANITKLP